MAIKKYYGEYLIAKEEDLLSFCDNVGYDWKNELKNIARRSTNKIDEGYLYLIEIWFTNLRKLIYAKKMNVYVFKQHQASQLGNSITDLKDSIGERILDINLDVYPNKEWAAINWCYPLDNQLDSLTIHFDTNKDALSYYNIHKDKLKMIFDAFDNTNEINK